MAQDEGEAPAEQWLAGPAGPWRHPHWRCAPPAGRTLSALSLTDAPRAVQKVPHAAALEALACLDCALRSGHAPALGRAAGRGPAPMGADAVPGCALASDPPAMDLGAGSALTTRAAAGRGPEVYSQALVLLAGSAPALLLLLLHGKALADAPRGSAAEGPLALVGSRTVAGPALEPGPRAAAGADPAKGAAAATAPGLVPRAAVPEAAACSGPAPRAAGVDPDLLLVEPRQIVAQTVPVA